MIKTHAWSIYAKTHFSLSNIKIMHSNKNEMQQVKLS